MKRAIAVTLLIGLLISLLAFSQNTMPIWQWVLPALVLLVLLAVLWNWSRVGAIFAGIILGALLLFVTAPTEDSAVIVISNSQNTYVIHNTCFLYCNPRVYKKYPYLPFTKYHKKLGEQAVISHRIEGDTIYLEDRLRTWLLIEE